MNVDMLLRHFNRILEAPDAVARLRTFILDLAIRGKLVDQNPEDEPASSSLARNDEKRKIVSREDRRADCNSQILLAEDERWDVPSTWSWRGLADLALFIDYRGQTPPKVDSGIRLLTAKNVKRGYINLNPEEFLSQKSYTAWMTRGLPEIGDVLFTTEAPLGNAAVVDISEPFALAQRVIDFRLYGDAVTPEFLVLQLLSLPFFSILNRAATGLTAKGIKAAKLKRLPIALPPLAEQHRIVAKVNELMALCDELEAAYNDREKHRDRMVLSSLKAMTEAGSGIYIDQISRLTKTKSHVGKLRQAILDLAVRGKLVDQDPADEPAILNLSLSELSLRSKKSIAIQPLTHEEYPYSIPVNWSWKRLGEIAKYSIPEKVDSNNDVLDATWVLDLEDIEKDSSRLLARVSAAERPFASSKTVFKTNDVLFGKLRPYLNKVLVAPEGGVCTTEIVPIRGAGATIPEYLALVLKSPLTMATVDRLMYGMKMPRLGTEDANKLLVPLPPLAEQHRIVAKVDELMALCDQLESEIEAGKEASGRFLEAVLKEALKA